MIVPLRLSVAASAAAIAFAAAAQAPAPLASGIDRSTFDPAVRVQDDAFRAVEGRWLADTPIPPDKNGIGAFQRLYDDTQPQLRALIEDAARAPADDADARKIADLYASFMDEPRVEALGATPIRPDLARVDAIATKGDVVATFASFARFAADVPFAGAVHLDAKDSTKYVFDLGQGGIGLPDRDYFIDTKDALFADVRAKYERYLAQTLASIGETDATARARAVIALEARIARAQWSRVENRDPVKTYNVVALAELPKLAPHIDWRRFVDEAGLAERVDSVVVSQPTYLKALDGIVATTPVATWKAYLKTRWLEAYAPLLSHRFVDARFAFFGTVLHGTPENLPRWKRGVRLVEESIGEALGRLYVARHFPPASKARMDALVANLLAAFRTSVDGLDWMGPETKREAKAKLATFVPKIGYPVRWRDYTALAIARGDLVGDAKHARDFEYRRNLDKLGRPVDRDEWGMTPQTINAYYNPEMNEIVFPAAILQPPFFDPAADDAVNYGAIGAVIGHEISHGFDDQGSQYDERGNLRDWWTDADRRRFAAKTQALVAQYGAFTIDGYHVNGELTLGENIADNSGLAIAYKAYRIALAGREAPVIEGLTGDQRFFLGFVQVWQEKERAASTIAQLKSDPHAPGEFRANGTLRNQAAFDDAFGVKPGDGMYLAPDRRVVIW